MLVVLEGTFTVERSEAHSKIHNKCRVSRKAKELLISMLLVVMIMMVSEVVMVILFFLFKFWKFWKHFGAEDDFLRVALVESIDKGSLFGLGYSANR